MHLFVFGTLLDPDLRRIVLGKETTARPAQLADHAVRRAAGHDWPAIVAKPGGVASGLLLYVDAEAAARADFYEAGHGATACAVEVRADDDLVPARLYRASETAGEGEADAWQLEAWQAAYGELTRRAAREAMAMFGHIGPDELRFRLPMIRARADAALRSQAQPMPTTLRTDLGRDAVEVLDHRQPYCHYFAVGATRLRHRLYKGGLSDVVDRAGLHMTEAVTVLPYDPARDRVLVIEQFRYGPWLRGDPFPWCLEPVAGRIEPGEAAETSARREAREEAHVEIGALHPIGSYYPSPGGVSEYMHSFIGVADLADRGAGIGGLDAEHEDIRAHVISFERLMDLVRSGEADTAPLLLSALWLDSARKSGTFA